VSESAEPALRAVLWDLDGTLVDSEEYHWLSWRDALRAEGIDLSHDAFLASFGQRNDRILAGWLGADVDPARVVRVGDGKEAEYRRLAETRGLTPLPGAREWLIALRRAGWKQAIASSAPRQNVETMLRVLDLRQYVDAIVSAEDVTIGKPDPQVFLAAAAKLRVLPSRAIVVEDAAAGVEGARRAGMRRIGVNPRSRLDADVYVKSLADLPSDVFDALLRPTAHHEDHEDH
jgi:HAD superfamily hydrolase (TIGR01509 family)